MIKFLSRKWKAESLPKCLCKRGLKYVSFVNTEALFFRVTAGTSFNLFNRTTAAGVLISIYLLWFEIPSNDQIASNISLRHGSCLPQSQISLSCSFFKLLSWPGQRSVGRLKRRHRNITKESQEALLASTLGWKALIITHTGKKRKKKYTVSMFRNIGNRTDSSLALNVWAKASCEMK